MCNGSEICISKKVPDDASADVSDILISKAQHDPKLNLKLSNGSNFIL